MPLYDYRCPDGHTTQRLVRYEERDTPRVCPKDGCGAELTRLFPLTHCVPDGMYSYAPNIGDPVAFEKRLIAMKEGKTIYKKELPPPRD